MSDAETSRSVSVSREIAADPATIFAVIADATKHHDFDGSGTVLAAKTGAPTSLKLGDKFGMSMKMGFPYSIGSTVVEYQENELIAWAHFGKHRWRYELEPTENGTLVTETFDWSTSRMPKIIELLGYPEKHPKAMEATLERLDELVTS